MLYSAIARHINARHINLKGVRKMPEEARTENREVFKKAATVVVLALLAGTLLALALIPAL